MEKTIVVPIDFKVESLNALRLALNTIQEGKVNVVLMYAETPSDSITEFLFYSPEAVIDSLKTREFEEAISILKNRYESLLGSVKIELFHGYTSKALANFLEAQKVSKIYFSKNYTLKPHKKGFDPIPLLKKAKIPYQEVGVDTDGFWSEWVSLNALFSF